MIIDRYISVSDLNEQEQNQIVAGWIANKESWEESGLASRKDIIESSRQAVYNIIGGYEAAKLNEEESYQLPICRDIKENAKQQLITSLCPTKRLGFRVAPKSRNDLLFCKRAQNFMEYILNEIDFELTLKKWVDAGLTDGIGIVKVGWKRETAIEREPYSEPVYEYKEEKKQYFDPITGKMVSDVTVIPIVVKHEQKWREEEVITCNKPLVEVVDIMNVYFDPTVSDIKEADFIEESFVDYDDLCDSVDEYGKSLYKNLDELKYKETQEYRDDVEPYTQKTANDVNISPENVRTLKNVKIWHCYGDLRYTEEGKTKTLKNYLFTIADESVLIRCEPNPYYKTGKHPYFIWSCFPHPFYAAASTGLVETILNIQRIINDYFRIMTASAKKELAGRFAVFGDELSEEEVDSLQGDGGSVIQLESDARIEKLPILCDFGALSNLISMLIDISHRNARMNSTTMGGSDHKKETATAHALRKEALNGLMADLLINLETPLSTLLGTIYKYCQMYCDDEISIRLNEDSNYTFEDYKRDELEKNHYDFEIKAIGDALVRAEQEEGLLNLIQISAKIPKLAQICNFKQAAIDYLRIGKVDNADKYYGEEKLISVKEARMDAVKLTKEAVTQALSDKDIQEMNNLMAEKLKPELAKMITQNALTKHKDGGSK